MANNSLLASDNFLSGSLAAGWAAYPGFSVCQVIVGSPNVTEGNIVGTTAGQIWTALGALSDQTSECTIQALIGAGTVTLTLRTQAGLQSGYLASLQGNGAIHIYRIDNGVLTTLKSATAAIGATGDVVSFQAAGACLSFYQNNAQIAYAEDATYTSGYPGYNQNTTVALTNSQISAWRCYNAIQQDGIWMRQGVVIPAIAADLTQATAGVGIQVWNIFQDGNAQLLAGTVFKAWIVSNFTNDLTSAMYYAESLDGKNWTRRGASVLGATNGYVFKSGSTYYMLAQAQGASGTGNMLVYTSSDGITWAQQTPSSVIGLGTAGQWDANGFYNIINVVNNAGTWYGYYNGAKTGTPFSIGLATSPDLINWTKYGGNPVISNFLISGQNIQKIGGNYYMWIQHCNAEQGGSVVSAFEAVRMTSTDLINWTLSSHSIHRTQMFGSVNAVPGGNSPMAILNVGGQTYLWSNEAENDSVAPQIGQIGLAIAPVTIPQLIGATEDGTLQSASDGFTSGVGSLPATWTTPTGTTALQIVGGNLVEGTVIATACVAAYTGRSFPASQYAEITLNANADAGHFVTPGVRMSTSAYNGYFLNLAGPLGSAYTLFQIYRKTAGVTTLLGPAATVIPNAGDTVRLSAINGGDGFPVLSAFHNGYLVLQVQDYTANPYLTGSPGMLTYAGTTLASARIAGFTAGAAGLTGGAGGSGDLGPGYDFKFRM